MNIWLEGVPTRRFGVGALFLCGGAGEGASRLGLRVAKVVGRSAKNTVEDREDLLFLERS